MSSGKHRAPRVVAAAAAVLLLSMAAALIGLRANRDGVLPGVVVAGMPVGGLGKSRVRATVEQLQAQRSKRTVTVESTPTPGSPKSVTATDADLGYELDVRATVERAFRRGRQANPLLALWDHLAATLGVKIVVAPVEGINRVRFDRWLAETSAALSAPGQEGGLTFDGATPTPVYPAPGSRVDIDDLRAKAERALRHPGPDRLQPKLHLDPPSTSRQDVDQLVETAGRAVSAPVRLNWPGGPLDFSPSRLGRILEGKPRKEAPPGQRLGLVVDPGKLKDVLATELGVEDSDPVDARFEVAGPSVRLIPSRDGFRVRLTEGAAMLTRLALSPGTREGELAGEVLQPRLTTAQAQSLNIARRVSTFTTAHACCQPRVRNIHRIADIVDQIIVRPGETFSLNQLVGRRTPERGFVPAPAIFAGKFVDEVGGGVSQFATTFFNAVFFGGYDIIEHQTHLYYFSRYPAGREATLSWPRPDLKFKNDSAAGILVDTSYTETSITVSFYGLNDVHVEVVTGERFNGTTPLTQCKPNPQVPPGQSRIVQEGGEGFDIVVERILNLPDGRRDPERFFTRYKPQPRIVEASSCA